MRRLILFFALGACATTEAGPQAAATVELAAVTLGDNCNRPPPPPAQPPAKTAAKPAPATPAAARPADCPVGGCGPSRSCEQTSMQLALKSPKGTPATAIKITRVELLDAKGKVLEVLKSRAPARWNAGTYVAWNETVTGGETLQVMYELDAPNWDKLTNGRWNAHEKTFQLRVTVAIGTANKTVEKQSITPARLPPPVPT